MSEICEAPVVRAEGLKRTFQEGKLRVEVLHGLDFVVEPGEKVAIVGASGSGKSTLLQLLGGLDLPTEGRVAICGEDISSLSDAARGRLRNRHVGFVYQFHHLLPEFTALENVAMPILLSGASIDDASEQATGLLERVGLGERIDHKPGELSGGERQRTAIARALANRPDVVLADEPTGNLDPDLSRDIMHLFEQFNQVGVSVLIASHDLDLISQLPYAQLRLHQGRLVNEGTHAAA